MLLTYLDLIFFIKVEYRILKKIQLLNIPSYLFSLDLPRIDHSYAGQ